MPKKSQTALGALLKQARASTQAKPRRKRAPKVKSHLEVKFRLLCIAEGLPPFVQHYKFHEGRKWEADFAWPEAKLLVEIEGGVWMRGGGRHNRGAGYIEDCRKYNQANEDGWHILRYTQEIFGDAPAQIREILAKSS